METIKIEKQRFVSTSVSLIKPKFGKSIKYNGLYFLFSPGSSLYPVELLFSTSGFEKYAIVFIQDETNNKWLGVFPNQVKQTLVFSKDFFLVHLKRLKENSMKPICVINNEEIKEKMNDVENIVFQKMTKIPLLPDSERNKKIFIKLSVGIFCFISTFFIHSFFLTDFEEKIDILNKENIALMNNFSSKKEMFEEVPNSDQGQELLMFLEKNEIAQFNGIFNGKVSK
jgi:hypothetical protein